MKLKALLLDLDGTLVDTAPEMGGTLNRLLRNHGQALADESAASKLVSNGARALIEFGFAKPLEEALILDLINQFLRDYAKHVADRSKLYAGMPEVLELCAENNIVWGVITNKPLELSKALLEGLGLFDSCSILLGGDSLPVKKPDPAPMLHSCMVLNLAPSECLYVGDHERDIIAGKNAGMDTAAALWGYINEDQNPENWGASYMVNEPSGLMQLVQEKLASQT
jgi:phosphoglycolate phosphatase